MSGDVGLRENERAASADEARWRERLVGSPLLVIAEVDGEACGLVAGDIERDTGEPILISLWVNPRFRGRGVAKALITEVEEWAAAEHGELSLSVRDDNAAARGLYEDLGYEVVGPTPLADDEHPEVTMRKTFES
ncbi:GNAT family N-acetyltransferase [Bowdeniella nasicola]|uniref:GNAT family N-acetyltransferase n=1 Tax=Bowdeniella nasicola TaxID=208480 RepID=UPI002481E6D8|nr:GNAT family N-acetyltransferase [Bowdeniella nasicola]